MVGIADVQSGQRESTVRVTRALVGFLLTLLVACGCSAPPEVPAVAAQVDAKNRTYATTAQVIEAVQAAQVLEALPSQTAKDLAKPEPEAAVKSHDCRPVDDKGTGAKPFGECAYGATVGQNLIVVYGDSRASMWNIPISNVAAEKGWQVRVFSFGGCPVPNLQFLSNQSNSPNQACDTYHVAAVEAIAALKPQVIVTTSVANQRLADGSNPSPAQWTDGWKSTFAELAPTGAKIAMLGDMPTWTTNDARCLAKTPSDVQACASDPAETAPGQPQISAEQAAAESAGVVYIAPTPWICAAKCEPVIAEKRVYANQYHLTADYADYLSGAVGEALAPLLNE